MSCKLLAISLLFFLGCARSEPQIITRTVYEPVPYPVPCKVDKPARPARDGDVLIDTLNILEYTERLETLLWACTGG